MQWNIGARPGVRRGGEVVGVGLARHLEDGKGYLLGQCRLGEEPLGLGPGLHDVLGHRVAGLGALFHVVEGIEHQQGVLELFAGLLGELGIVQQLDQGGDVVAALHGAQQFDRVNFIDQRRGRFPFGNGRQEASFDVGGFVDTGRNAIGD